MLHAHDRKHVVGSCVAGLVVATAIATIGFVTRPQPALAARVTRTARGLVEPVSSGGLRPPEPPAKLNAQTKAGAGERAAAKPKAPATLGTGVKYAAMIGKLFGSRTPQALRIAICESSLNPGAIGPGGRGLFQINPHHHMWRVKAVGGTSIFDPLTNVRVAKHLFDEQGWRPWSCARRLGIR